MEPEDEAFEELALKQGHWQHTSGWRKKQIMKTSMTDKDAMAMALDALETLMIERESIYEKAIAALKERLAQPHETTLKEFNQFIHDDPKYHIWAKEKEALADPMREVQRLGQEIEFVDRLLKVKNNA